MILSFHLGHQNIFLFFVLEVPTDLSIYIWIKRKGQMALTNRIQRWPMKIF